MADVTPMYSYEITKINLLLAHFCNVRDNKGFAIYSFRINSTDNLSVHTYKYSIPEIGIGRKRIKLMIALDKRLIMQKNNNTRLTYKKNHWRLSNNWYGVNSTALFDGKLKKLANSKEILIIN